MEPMIRFASTYAAGHPTEAAQRLEGLPTGEVVSFLAHVDPGIAAGVLDRMVPAIAAACIGEMEADRAAEILHLLPVQRAVAILRYVDPETRTPLMSGLPEKLSVQIYRALQYPEGSAGGMADASVKPLPSDMKIGEARDVARDPRFPYVYVVDREDRLVGVAHKRDVQTGDDHAPLEAVVAPDVIRVPARLSGAELQRHRAWRDLDALPVVDRKGVYLGAIRHKTLRERGEPVSTVAGAASPLSGFLDLTELYWTGLSAVVAALAADSTPIREREPHDEG
jgi:magnesium transporter